MCREAACRYTDEEDTTSTTQFSLFFWESLSKRLPQETESRVTLLCSISHWPHLLCPKKHVGNSQKAERRIFLVCSSAFYSTAAAADVMNSLHTAFKCHALYQTRETTAKIRIKFSWYNPCWLLFCGPNSDDLWQLLPSQNTRFTSAQLSSIRAIDNWEKDRDRMSRRHIVHILVQFICFVATNEKLIRLFVVFSSLFSFQSTRTNIFETEMIILYLEL